MRALVAAALGLLVVSVLLLAASRWPFAKPAAPDALRLALSSTPHAALLHIAAAKGLFAEEGLDVTVVPVSHGKAALDLLAQGKVDLAAAAEVPFVISVLRGEPFSIAASMMGVSTEMAVIGRRDRGIAAPAHLVGKKVGVTRGTSGEYFLWAFLIRNKLPPDAVMPVDLPPGRIAGELASGSVDAISTWQPIRLNAESALAGGAVTFTAPEAYTVTHVVVGRSDYLQGHANTLRKLVRALLKAERFNRSDPEQAVTLAAQRLNLDAKTLRTGWEDLGFRVNLLQSQLVTLEDEARWAMARGHAAQQAMPNFLSHLYLDALLNEQPDRVTVVH
jgi:NitT/TauT family transport system substrate-binding protein